MPSMDNLGYIRANTPWAFNKTYDPKPKSDSTCMYKGWVLVESNGWYVAVSRDNANKRIRMCRVREARSDEMRKRLRELVDEMLDGQNSDKDAGEVDG